MNATDIGLAIGLLLFGYPIFYVVLWLVAVVQEEREAEREERYEGGLR